MDLVDSRVFVFESLIAISCIHLVCVFYVQMSGNSHFLAVGDEDGFVSLYDTRQCLPSAASCMEKSGVCWADYLLLCVSVNVEFFLYFLSCL